jgi:Protein of unknown function (DUF3467)
MAKEKAGTENVPQQQPAPSVKWNSANLHSSYANYCNANSTREEVVLNFGVNNNWDRTQAALEVELNHRVVLSPFAAKRLAVMLQQLLKEYESRYGALPE